MHTYKNTIKYSAIPSVEQKTCCVIPILRTHCSMFVFVSVVYNDTDTLVSCYSTELFGVEGYRKRMSRLSMRITLCLTVDSVQSARPRTTLLACQLHSNTYSHSKCHTVDLFVLCFCVVYERRMPRLVGGHKII